MAWAVEFHPQALKDLGKLDKSVARKILLFLHERLAKRADARSVGEALKGPELDKYWKYRVGDYRLVCSIQDKRVTILVVRVGHRREVYRR